MEDVRSQIVVNVVSICGLRKDWNPQSLLTVAKAYEPMDADDQDEPDYEEDRALREARYPCQFGCDVEYGDELSLFEPMLKMIVFRSVSSKPTRLQRNSYVRSARNHTREPMRRPSDTFYEGMRRIGITLIPNGDVIHAVSDFQQKNCCCCMYAIWTT